MGSTNINKLNSNLEKKKTKSIYKVWTIQVNWKKLQNSIELSYIIWKINTNELNSIALI
jgi:hypothetical protein